MNSRLTQAVIIVVSVALFGCVGAFLTAPNGRVDAQHDRAAAVGKNLSHLGQPGGEHVTLEVVGGMKGGCGRAELDFVRVLPDGDIETSPGGLGYRVPEGKLLVVTDVDWQYVHPKGAEGAGKIQILRLTIENLSKPENRRRAFDSTITLSIQGEGGVSVSMRSGFVVSSKAADLPRRVPRSARTSVRIAAPDRPGVLDRRKMTSFGGLAHGDGYGDDILIAGHTTYDANDTALAAIIAEWTSSDSFVPRIADLSDVRRACVGFIDPSEVRRSRCAGRLAASSLDEAIRPVLPSLPVSPADCCPSAENIRNSRNSLHSALDVHSYMR